MPLLSAHLETWLDAVKGLLVTIIILVTIITIVIIIVITIVIINHNR